MIVNAALCACWQGSARQLKRQVDLPVWGRRSENGTSLRLVVSNLGTFAVSPLWQELRVPPIGFWGVFSALYQTCRLLSPVPRLQLRKVGGQRDAGGVLTDRPWPRRSPGRKRGWGRFVMAALTRTSPTIFSRLVSDCQAERKLALHNSLDLVFFTPWLWWRQGPIV